MKRMLGLPVRLGLAGSVFAITFCVAAAVPYFSMEALHQGNRDLVALAALGCVWALLAYFPSRQIYLAVTYKWFHDEIHCEHCGYDLTGNTTGICPECGDRAQVAQDHIATAERVSKMGTRTIAITLIAFLAGIGLATWISREPLHRVPAEFEVARGGFFFARWNEESGNLVNDPNSIFAVINGKLCARFTFLTAQEEDLVSAGISDSFGRPWLSADFTTGRFDVNEYAPASTTLSAPVVAVYSDTDGDGVVDRRIDLVEGTSRCLDCGPDMWRPCKQSD